MKRLPWILAAIAAVSLLLLGIHRAGRPTSVLIPEAEAQARLEDLAARFSAAIENQRDIAPLVAEVKPIVDQRPNLRDGRKLLGQVYARLGRIDEAYAQFDAALDLDPDDAQLHNLTGTAALMLDRADEAEAHHRRAIALAPGEPALKIPLADILLKQGKFDDARDLLLRALEQQLTLWDANALLSDVYFARAMSKRDRTPPDDAGSEADLRLAITQMETALAKASIKPDRNVAERVVLTRKLARLYAALGQPMESLSILDALPDAARFSKDVLAEMAEYFAQNNQAALAGVQYAIAAERSPHDADLLAAAAHWYHVGGDNSAARVMLDRLKQAAPRHPRLPELTTRITPD